MAATGYMPGIRIVKTGRRRPRAHINDIDEQTKLIHTTTLR